MTNLTPKILTCIRQARQWVLRFVRHKPQFTHGLAGACAIASCKLFISLNKAKVRGVKLWYGEAHAFLQVKNYIVDVTASQFGHEPILIVKIGSARHKRLLKDRRVYPSSDFPEYKFSHYKRCRSFSSVEELVQFQIKHSMPLHQTYKIK